MIPPYGKTMAEALEYFMAEKKRLEAQIKATEYELRQIEESIKKIREAEGKEIDNGREDENKR